MIKLGIAGLGKMGKLHYKNAMINDDVDIVAVSDMRKSNLKIIENNGVKKYSDYKDMVNTENLDAIIISLPNFLKKESILLSAENDFAIFVDKPLARNFTEAEEILSKIRKNGTQITVGVNYRYFKSMQKVKDAVDNGYIGEVVLTSSELVMDGPFSHPLIPTPVADWWLDKELSGGGVLLDLGYHLLDLLLWVLGDLEVEYSALKYRYNLSIEDAATLVLSSRNGVRSSLNVGWFSKMLFPNFNFRVNMHGTVGYISTDHYAPKNMYVHAVKEGMKNFLRRITARRIDYLSYTYYYSSFVDVLNDFIDNVKKGTNSPVDLIDQLSVMKILDDAYKMNGVTKTDQGNTE